MILNFNFHCTGCTQPDLAAQITQLAADFANWRVTMSQAADDILREVQETKAQAAAAVAAITQLVGVVTPLMEAAAAAQAALAAAQAELAAMQSANAELDARLSGAAADLDSTQQSVQAALDAIPPAPAPVPAEG